jgi:RHS repeat-associated protein
VPLCEFTYDADGNLLSDGVFTYSYDAANRLSSVSSNGTLLASFAYDAQGRRVRKVTPSATHAYFYDGWLLVRETLTTNNYQLTTDYVWGKDIAGIRGGAAGIGGLLYLRRDGAIYVPWYDAYGNVLGYCDAQGNVVAEYTYDAFGNIIAQSGPMADDFAFRYSTKYFDREVNLYYYGYRYYSPILMRWLNRDPIEEGGGNNLYAFCVNNGVCRLDPFGNFSLNLYWRELTSEERLDIKTLATQIAQKCDLLIASIDNFYLQDFPQAIPAPEVGFVQPREIDRSADISKLDEGLVEFFMLREHRNQGSLNWALSQLKWRLAEEKKIAQFNFYRMSTCRNILCYAGIEALKTPLFIGFCKKQWDQEDVGTKRALLAHEASHMFHSTLDLYYREGGDPLLPFNRLRDAYAWGLLFAY